MPVLGLENYQGIEFSHLTPLVRGKGRGKANMSETTPSLFSEAFRAELRDIVKEAIQAANQNGNENKRPVEAANPYLTVKEAANLSRLGQSTIRLMIRKRELKAHQVGSRIIIRRTDLEKFLEAYPIEIISD